MTEIFFLGCRGWCLIDVDNLHVEGAHMQYGCLNVFLYCGVRSYFVLYPFLSMRLIGITVR